MQVILWGAVNSFNGSVRDIIIVLSILVGNFSIFYFHSPISTRKCPRELISIDLLGDYKISAEYSIPTNNTIHSIDNWQPYFLITFPISQTAVFPY